MKSLLLLSFFVVFIISCSNVKTPPPPQVDIAKITDSIKMALQAQISDSIKKAELENRDEWLLSKAGKIFARHPDWSEKDCERIARGEKWIGMKIAMVYEIYGPPDDINYSDFGRGNEHQYCWYDHTPCYFYTGANRIVKSFN